ncbi:Tim17/Tim22/Tim23/Pmp24 family-domain-containing protein [Syncephalis fuscata]|nr:Tim17/Tim22/Tim23/Pmp24 family-domain-containing protein [Syncephalis fuscata]
MANSSSYLDLTKRNLLKHRIITTDQQKIAHQVMESCAAKTVFSGGAGFGLGALFGLFMAGLDFSTPEQHLNRPEPKLKEQVKDVFKDMGKRSYSSAKNFAVVAAIYTGVECYIKSYRATNDLYNSVSAGCITGGILAAKGGPKMVVGGCAGFAAFSAAIDWYMHKDR